MKERANKSEIVQNGLNQLQDKDILSSLGTMTEGYLPGDLKQLLERALHAASIRIIKTNPSHPSLLKEDFDTAKADFIPVSLKGIQLHKSEVKWNDIGGLEEVRQTLKETLEWPSKYPKLFEDIPLRPRSGFEF